MNRTWRKNKKHPNEILEGFGYYVSYNPQIGASIKGQLFEMVGVLAELGPSSEEETALVLDDGINEKIYKILNGDFRKEYESLTFLRECSEFFDSKKAEFGSGWSTLEEDRPIK